HTRIQATQPCVSRTVIEQAEIGPIPRQRTGQREGRGQELARDTKTLGPRGRLKFSPRQPGAVDCGREPTKVSVAEDCRIQDIDRFVIETFEDCTRNVEVGIVDQKNRALIWPTVRSRRGTRWGRRPNYLG